MKANAPEKIYLFENPITETPDNRWMSKRSDDNDIEYIRTDVFIEKLDCWLYEKGREYAGEFDEGFLIEFNKSEEAIKDFIKYMKGE